MVGREMEEEWCVRGMKRRDGLREGWRKKAWVKGMEKEMLGERDGGRMVGERDGGRKGVGDGWREKCWRIGIEERMMG